MTDPASGTPEPGKADGTAVPDKPVAPDEPTMRIDLPTSSHLSGYHEARPELPRESVDPDLTERIDLPAAAQVSPARPTAAPVSPASTAERTTTDSDLTERIALPVDAAQTATETAAEPAKEESQPAASTQTVAPTDEPTELLDAPKRAGAPASARERLSRLRRSRAGAVIGVLAALLGFGIVVQAHSTETNTALPAARQEDLVRILDDLDAQQDRLRGEIGQLQTTRTQLSSGTAGSDAALAEARRRTQTLGLLAGTVPATGPGLLITITDPRGLLSAEVVLDAVEELRGAGAEAMQINGTGGQSVRIVVSTYFLNGQGTINVSGKTLSAPYQLLVIGDSATLDAALRIPGGVVDTVTQQGAKIAIEQRGSVTVSALRPATSPQYARPTS
ncbi:hypothetical protein GCM10009765_48820 [Fodinicola feengrottensis]|uniref:DUF881 domain-containing protein n=2 Tax=Fodinicola feengrottensis TaxID=435914 RepID=A0ABN2HUH5_9ACTN